MATFVPAKRGVAYTTYISLVSRTTRPQFQSNPTLAAGDVKVSKDGGALANITTLPVVSPAASVQVKIDLSGTEMTADFVTVIFQDAAGAEWDDIMLVIPTVARQIDDLTFPNVSGRGIDVDATGGVEITVDQSVNVNKWLTVTPNALNSGLVQSDVQRWLNVVVNALISGNVPSNVQAMALDVITSAALDIGAGQEIADRWGARNIAGGSDGGRINRDALRALRNKVDAVLGIVYQEDDSTTAWTFVITTAAGNPVTIVDPA